MKHLTVLLTLIALTACDHRDRYETSSLKVDVRWSHDGISTVTLLSCRSGYVLATETTHGVIKVWCDIARPAEESK